MSFYLILICLWLVFEGVGKEILVYIYIFTCSIITAIFTLQFQNHVLRQEAISQSHPNSLLHWDILISPHNHSTFVHLCFCSRRCWGNSSWIFLWWSIIKVSNHSRFGLFKAVLSRFYKFHVQYFIFTDKQQTVYGTLDFNLTDNYHSGGNFTQCHLSTKTLHKFAKDSARCSKSPIWDLSVLGLPLCWGSIHSGCNWNGKTSSTYIIMNVGLLFWARGCCMSRGLDKRYKSL